MTTILNPKMVDHETKFDRLARQVERIDRMVDYDEDGRRNEEIDLEDLENNLRNRDDNMNLGGDMNHVVRCCQNAEGFDRIEEFDLEFSEVDLAELKKGPPYVCSLLKKIANIEKSNDIFDVLLKDKQLVLPEGKTLLWIKDLKGKPYCKFHQATSHSNKNCVCLRDLIQETIMEGRLKFNDGNKDMKVDSDPFDAGANFMSLSSWG
ncbi:hypothetical protein Ahy_A09g045018 isoform A [Arachis hypogaea]|uniref:Uncharacterized protein n=1 Tax=Arachis hypogaea TaxID=3818 RepID=A0A445BLB5_ARAHY|nr:hypothetical protein Ahy_A09g045018 isoform A [Arachis hypogaea]